MRGQTICVYLLITSQLVGCATFRSSDPAPLPPPPTVSVKNAKRVQPVAYQDDAAFGDASDDFGDFGDFGGGPDDGRSMREGEDITGATLAVDVDFQDESISVVMFTLLFDDSKFKIYGNEDQPVTATLRALTFEDAMQQLTEQTDLLIVRRGERFIVYADGADEMLGDREISYVYTCRKAKAADIISTLEGQPPEGFPSAGSPYLGETDVPTQEVSSGSEVMAEEGLTSPLGKNVEYQIVHHMNAIILRGKIGDLRRAVDFVRLIDQPIPIVTIELLIVQYFHENGFSWRYNLLDGQIAKGDPPRSNGSDPGIELDDDGEEDTFGPGLPWGVNVERIALSAAAGGGPLHFSGVGQLTGQFKQNVQLLVNESMARIVTNPHVAVVNSHQGNILLNEKFNFFTNIVQPLTGTIEQQQQELNNVTAFSVTPTIVGPDRIHMAVNSTVSAFVGTVTGGLTSGLPDQRINDIATAVVLSNNETLIVGGLVKEEVVEQRDKIPGLGDIPLVGELFRGRNENRRFTETVIYITPRLVQGSALEDEYVRQVFMQSDRLYERGQEVRRLHREDKQRGRQSYYVKERLDKQSRKDMYEERDQIKESMKYYGVEGWQDGYLPDDSSSTAPALEPAVPMDGGAFPGMDAVEPVDAFPGTGPADAFPGAEPVNPFPGTESVPGPEPSPFPGTAPANGAQPVPMPNAPPPAAPLQPVDPGSATPAQPGAAPQPAVPGAQPFVPEPAPPLSDPQARTGRTSNRTGRPVSFLQQYRTSVQPIPSYPARVTRRAPD